MGRGRTAGDMTRPGRPFTSETAAHPGEANGRAKLTAEQVRRLRSRVVSIGVFCRETGIDYQHASKIRRGLVWREET